METQQQLNYNRVAAAITYLQANFRQQPDLDKIAEQVHLSPFHFQRLFTEWAGVSPKQFIGYLSIEYAKQVLKEKESSLLDTAYETGLSGTGRLHDLFIKIEGMTPGAYKNGGAALDINYSYATTPFGNILTAATEKGICYMAFADDETLALAELKALFPNAHYRQLTDQHQQNALHIFHQDGNRLQEVKLHLKGTPFQIKVWEALLKVPSGDLTTYGRIADAIEHPAAYRAVGTAVGQNPVAYLIPCHRVIQSGGAIGQYHWGSTRKNAMIGWEAAQQA
ncbi:methylated-DNA--[protein]-cysteine S-methyltransferase [Taibaiella chishuiensis]|uniref:methylated-DNA--[protein]-cysteine S-methyltransferase n=1 Tax=Taibaiella chishuiensis TaxID=1434707 RepID=A0A2P8D5L5_9BACT|nr:methylated-DNA--[protein]-cysteine S-methyltransferase [Taibaiella chishuiensis]PSK92510.1 DNA-O6-methylguanine--protein-cysteine S-methyltransferase /transcriptional regulator Ada [Taibaiella chishuiensis]